jgi:hypothetical protein
MASGQPPIRPQSAIGNSYDRMNRMNKINSLTPTQSCQSC